MIDASKVTVSLVSPDTSMQPLSDVGALATLLAVEQVVTVQDAANAVGLTPADLIAEAEAWAVAAALVNVNP